VRLPLVLQSLVPAGQTEQQKKKHSLSHSDVPPAKTQHAASKHAQCAMKVQVVEKIVLKLNEKHQSKFSIEELSAYDPA